MANSKGHSRSSAESGSGAKKRTDSAGSSSTGNKKKKKKKGRVGVIILIVLLVVLVALIALAIFMLTKSKPEESTDVNFDIDLSDEDEDDEEIDEDALELNEDEMNTTLEAVDSTVTTDEGWVHYLLLGVDGSTYSSVRSDAMIVLSYSLDQGRVVLSSIPRDTLVYIDGKGFDKLTHAYAYGGAALTVQTFKENFDIDISGYITVDFDAMVEVVDLVGGLTLTITDAEAKHMGDYYAAWGLSGGTQLLDGKEVLAYCRVRKIDSDYQRTERQYNTLVALYQKVKGCSVSQYTQMINAVYDDIHTDLTVADLISLAGTLLDITKTADLENVKLVDAAHSTTGKYSSKSVVLMDNLVDTVTRWREALGITDYVPSERTQQISDQLSKLTVK